MTVDAHTHLLPDRLARKIRSFFDERMPEGLAYGIEPEKVLDSHAEIGIDTVWNLPYVHKPGMAGALNESMADLALELTGRGVEIITGCTVHVEDDDPAQLLHDAVKLLESQICKLHCSVGKYEPDDERFDDFWTEAAALRVPVIVHAGHDVSGYTQANELDPIERVASANPGAIIVIAHCGHKSYERALEILEASENVYADLTPVVSDRVPLTTEQFEQHQSKLMFGTDAPNTGLTAAQLLRGLTRDIDPEARQAIFGGNARTLVELAGLGV